MERHKFDALSFFFGGVFAALAASVLFVDELDAISGRWVWPIVLILGGLVMLVSMVTGHRRSNDREEQHPTAGSESVDDDSALLAEAAAELPDEPHLR